MGPHMIPREPDTLDPHLGAAMSISRIHNPSDTQRRFDAAGTTTATTSAKEAAAAKEATAAKEAAKVEAPSEVARTAASGEVVDASRSSQLFPNLSLTRVSVVVRSRGS